MRRLAEYGLSALHWNQSMNNTPPKPHAPDSIGKHLPGPKEPKPAGMNRQAFRSLKCALTHDEFAAVRWAANRAGESAMPLADFFRAALLEKVQAVARQDVARGRKLPPDIAHLMATAKVSP
jgi:hypothetical protein